MLICFTYSVPTWYLPQDNVGNSRQFDCTRPTARRLFRSRCHSFIEGTLLIKKPLAPFPRLPILPVTGLFLLKTSPRLLCRVRLGAEWKPWIRACAKAVDSCNGISKVLKFDATIFSARRQTYFRLGHSDRPDSCQEPMDLHQHSSAAIGDWHLDAC